MFSLEKENTTTESLTETSTIKMDVSKEDALKEDRTIEILDENDEKKMDSLGARMKSYERTDAIPPYQAFLVRADGCCFSKFTENLPKPFDVGFQRAIIRTANEVMNFFQARTVFCCSDEITLIFPPICTKEEYERLVKSGEKNLPTHNRAGRCEKIASLVASKCSVYFNQFMLDELNKQTDRYTQTAIRKIRKCDAVFDGRLISIPLGKEIEIVNNIIWRSSYDCRRNCISAYGRYHLGHNKCIKKSGDEMIEMMKDDGFDMNSIPMSQIYGVLCKKILVAVKIDEMKLQMPQKSKKNKKTKSASKERKTIETKTENTECMRSKVYNFSTNLIKEDRQKTLELFIEKYYTPKITSEEYVLE
jgi:tRNA(His) 5'-end guanylyltransferase